MNTIDVYSQYFAARCEYNGVPRRAAVVSLTCTSGGGEVCYEVIVSFFPHRDDTDFAVSYDACAQTIIQQRKGRRSKKREAALMEEVRPTAGALAASLGGEIFWTQPLREARLG